MRTHWLDRMTSPIAPRWTLKRQRARLAMDLVQRHYEAAAVGRRTQGWRKSGGDANAVIGPVLQTIREHARDLVRNNPYAASALSTIADHAIGWGIVPKSDKRAMEAWKRWGETTDCDADGRHDFYGLQKLVKRTVVESGEILVRRRFRRPTDGLAIPMQLQMLDPDFLDTSKDTIITGAGPLIIQGVEYDGIGRRIAYWLFKEHPGSGFSGSLTSQRVPASEIQHIFRPDRPGQVRGVSWFAPVLLRFKDFDEYEDATLMKQKIAACLAVIKSGVDSNGAGLGTVDSTASPQVDSLEPGAILDLGPDQTVQVVNPPRVDEYDTYATAVLRAIATGLGVTYEDLTGDYKDMPFSAARMSRIRHWARVEDWRWRIIIPQFCEPSWRWFIESAQIMGLVNGPSTVTWSAPPAPMVDPVNEGLAIQRNVRSGIQSLSDALRERGMDPSAVFAEIKADNDKLDQLGIILDSDPRKMTQAGQLQGEAARGPAPAAEPVDDEALERAYAIQPRR